MKYNPILMNSLDMYLSSLSIEEYERFKYNIDAWKSEPLPLLSWDVFMEGYDERLLEAKKRTDLEKVNSFAKQFKWQNNLDLTFAVTDFEALIITDKNQKIIWVNEGFTAMTGYPKSYALDKTPRFLQGKSTSLETKARFKSKIQLEKPFTDTIINHRKDNSTYKCEVKIIPLYNEETTHFMALEKQVV
ncbi:MAG: PAS domain-containing protein [Bacteroidota bacterium]